MYICMYEWFHFTTIGLIYTILKTIYIYIYVCVCVCVCIKYI